MKYGSMCLAVVLAGLVAPATAEVPVKLTGAGATFPAPLYKQWIKRYRGVEPKLEIDYAAVGSGEGVARFLDDKVDFGASDVPLTEAQAKAAPHGALNVPATAGMIVLVYNLPGLNGPLKLSRDTYVALLMGRIPRWNDARIQAVNPDLKLPDREIVLVARRDSSGTTAALTRHLDAVSPAWSKRGPGVGKLVNWPAESMLVNGNEGVASRIKLAVGAIGYVEYGFARQLGLPMAWLENKAGHFVAPTEAAGTASIAANPPTAQADAALVDPAGAQAYPLVSYSWLLLKKTMPDAAKASALKGFVAWGLSVGQEQAPALGYLKLPPEVSRMGRDLLASAP